MSFGNWVYVYHCLVPNLGCGRSFDDGKCKVISFLIGGVACALRFFRQLEERDNMVNSSANERPHERAFIEGAMCRIQNLYSVRLFRLSNRGIKDYSPVSFLIER